MDDERLLDRSSGYGSSMRRICVLLMAALVLTSCGDDAGTPPADRDETYGAGDVDVDTDRDPGSTVLPPEGFPTEACDRAFEDAATGDSTDDGVDVLAAAAQACTSLADWTAGARTHPDAIDGADPTDTAEDVCRSDAELAEAALCREVLG